MNGIFITGSNTEVGKTTVAVEIARRLSENRKVRVRKPVESDCPIVGAKFAPRDAMALSEACGNSESLSIVCPYCFELEASAEKASNEAGKSLGLEQLVAACKQNTGDDFVLVEGAGGFYSPIAEQVLNADLASALNLPLVVVVRDELGAISQALLTIDAAHKNNLKVACVVLNRIESNALSNLEALKAYTKTPLVGFSLVGLDRFWADIKDLI
ncbi:MAG TPA: dethiobiotin synthase [Candidatus Thioglobus sp.]|jgi:dethiobiotin synthetase|nr:dethiobiotin synthase [Candidatus Thioglobus sp.]HIL20257.1 dethiobiotin synthase [Candidatus Thioglobus sp.]